MSLFSFLKESACPSLVHSKPSRARYMLFFFSCVSPVHFSATNSATLFDRAFTLRVATRSSNTLYAFFLWPPCLRTPELWQSRDGSYVCASMSLTIQANITPLPPCPPSAFHMAFSFFPICRPFRPSEAGGADGAGGCTGCISERQKESARPTLATKTMTCDDGQPPHCNQYTQAELCSLVPKHSRKIA